jgi:general secretion pathway protein D
MMLRTVFFRIFLVGLILAGGTGCAGERAFNTGEKLVRQERYDEAVSQYAEAVQKDPASDEYRMRLFAARNRAALEHLAQARKLSGEQQYQAAINEYLQSIALDPSLEIASQELKKTQDKAKAEQLVDEARQFLRQRRQQQALNALDQALQLVPDHIAGQALREEVRHAGLAMVDGYELDTNSTAPITLKFKDAKVKDVFKILSNLSGITFIFDEKVDASRVTIQLENAPFSQALELLLKMNELAMRVLNPKTVILYPKTKDKEKQYEDQIIQTFYLSNIDAKKAVNLLRTMLQLRKIYVHEELNALVIRDTLPVVKLAQQILEAADRGGAEVLYVLELIEVEHNDNFNLGARLDSASLQGGLGRNGALVTGPFESLSNLNLLYTIPTATFDLQKSLSDSEILANPMIRLKNGAKAKVHVGSREPIVTTTNNATGDVTSTNIQYVDVGVKLDLEANIQLDNTVQTKINLEVSNKGGDVKAGDNVAFAISTTNAQTELVLKDGERTILGGLIKEDESKGSTRLPIIGNIPLIGDLLASHSDQKKRREILLSITPHIVRQLDLPKADVASIWSGGEDDLMAGPSLSSFAVILDAEQMKRRPAVAPAVIPESQESTPMEMQESAQSVPSTDVSKMSESELMKSLVNIPAGVETQMINVETAPDETANPDQTEQMPAMDQSPQPETEVPQVELTPSEVKPAPQASRVFLVGPALVDAGEEFGLIVRVADVDSLFSAPMFINYDSNLLEFQRVEEGDFLSQSGEATVFTTSPNPAQGRIIVGYKQASGGIGASGSGDLYLLVFTAKQPGKAAISLDRANFSDPAGNRLPVSVVGALIEIR